MERQLGLRKGQPPIVGYEAAAQAADLPGIRFFNVPQRFAPEPAASVEGRWEVLTPTSALSCTAVGFFFAQALHQARGEAVGLLHATWGGTNATCWTPPADLDAEPMLKRVMDKYRTEVATYPQALAAWPAKEPEALAAWEKAVAAATASGAKAPAKPGPPADPRTNFKAPGFLYHAMVAPLAPYGLRGVLWYQGENNAKAASEYEVLLPAMIRGWRRTFERPELPFLIVEIAPHERMTPEIREAQQRIAARVPGAGIISTIDVGDAKDIHPPAKRPVGERLASLARRQVYGEDVVASGPRVESVAFDGPRAVITFRHIDGGLKARDAGLRGFTLAGADGTFVEAQAVIEGATVVVTAPGVSAPTAVRYGWSAVPEATLFNGAGWPAFPFRSDQPGK
jgi:sialate O-acetylesterase